MIAQLFFEFHSYLVNFSHLKQKQCSNSSINYEPFTVLSLPIEFSEDKAQYARIKIIYISDIDKYKRYDIAIKPG